MPSFSVPISLKKSEPSSDFAPNFFLIILCAFWGLYGFFLGFLAIFIHLFYLENYGVPYAHPMVEERGRLSTAFQDFMVRYPLKRMKYRPEFTKEGARVRQKEDEDEK